MQISIIILAQQEKLLKQCLSRIRLYTEGSYELIVINDGASEEITRWLGLSNDIKTITNAQYVGVAKGYNQGAAIAVGDRLVFIRDHMAVSERWLASLNACLDKYGDNTIAGPVSNDISGMQRVSFDCDNMEQLNNASKGLSILKKGRYQSVTRIISNLFIINNEWFRKLEGFDERFLLESYEDDDFCYRALQAGCSLYVTEDCFVRYVAPPSLFPETPNWYFQQLQHNKAVAREKWGFDLTAALLNWKQPVTVSLCMLVKNNEETLEECLLSVCEWVDEIIIVDIGSTDRTKEIALRFTGFVVDYEGTPDLVKARNLCFSLATQKYILWLEADDVVLPMEAEKLKYMLSHMGWNTDSVAMYDHYSFGENSNMEPSSRTNRLVKRERDYKWVGAVNQYLDVQGNIVQADICITHNKKYGN
jgi:glycosyltransferase involved in cell wall biosynthesis